MSNQQVLGNLNPIGYKITQTVSNWIGTRDAFDVTEQLNMKETGPSMGSVKLDTKYIVHPDWIKQGLRVGEAFYVTKLGGFKMDKVKIKYT